MSDPVQIRVLIVDDHPVVRDGLRNLILAFEDLELVGEAENGKEALLFCRQVSPDVVLMDVFMPVMDGIEATRLINEQHPRMKVIILTNSPDEDHIQKALQAGAVGYLIKNAPIDTLAFAIRSAFSGQSVLSQEAASALVKMKNRPPEPGSDLSQRELEVLALVAQGLSNEEIAERLVISPATARHHVSACINKLDASNRAQAAALAVKYGLVS